MSAQTTGPRAVFISYASQDAEAAGRICEALRGAGVEVWFDRDELVGGDAWDTKIRRQIGECALFLPMISATTQARLEGYFRLEWKIAAQRTHTMADEKAFILPIVIDGTHDAGAKVPPEFKAVQWTRLPAGETSPAFCARVRKLIATEDDAAEPTTAAFTPAGAARVGQTSRGRGIAWTRYLWAAFGVGMGLFFMVRGMWFRTSSRSEKVQPVAVAKPAPVDSAAPAAVPKFNPQRVALTRFENLTGDPALDALARVIESELLRNFGQAQQARVQPVEVSGRVAGGKAAHDIGAASYIVGSFLRAGDQLEITAQIVLTDQGELYGTAGPVAVPVTGERSEGLTELAERLTTGVSNVAITLQNPPTRLSAAIYTRPWPRFPMVGRVTALRSLPGDKWEETAAGYRKLLAEAPELLRIKHELARLLRDYGRFDEAQTLFDELLRQDRSKLSELEILGIDYDNSLLGGDPNRALASARLLLELRPVSEAVTQLIACLWGLNRPAAAYRELSQWWEKYSATVPPQSRDATLAGVYATEALMHLQYGRPEKTLETLDRMEKALDGQPFSALGWMRLLAYGQLGREADQQAVITEITSTPSGQRVEPISLQWIAYQQALHLGRPEAAAHWLAALNGTNGEIERAGQLWPEYDVTLMWLHEAAGRPEESLKVLERIVGRFGETASTVGSRAILMRRLGRADAAEAEERRLERWERRNARGLPAYWRARIAARAGEKERAVALLREAVGAGLWFGGFNSTTFEYGRSEPDFASLRGYAPYEQLLKPRD